MPQQGWLLYCFLLINLVGRWARGVNSHPAHSVFPKAIRVEYWFWMVLDGLGISLQH